MELRAFRAGRIAGFSRGREGRILPTPGVDSPGLAEGLTRISCLFEAFLRGFG